jgi:hypothetical protein
MKQGKGLTGRRRSTLSLRGQGSVTKESIDVRLFAKASSAGSTEGNGNGLSGRGAWGSVGQSGTPSDRHPRAKFLVLVSLAVLANLAFGVSFAAATSPTVTMGTATNPGYTTVDVTGEVNPQSEPVEYFYEVSTDGVAWERKNLSNFSAEATPQPFPGTITGLRPETAYKVRLVAFDFADNSTTISAGPDPEFTTLGPVAKPAVSIASVTTSTDSAVHISGEIDPGAAHSDPGFDVHWHFECEPSCSSFSNGGGEFTDDGTTHTVQTDAGVAPNRPYTIKLVAENAGGSEAATTTFHTVAPPPAVETIPAFALGGGTRALVGGYVNPENSETDYWIEYGPTSTYGSSLPATKDAEVGSGEQPVLVTQELTGLQPSTTYHFRLVAESNEGPNGGNDLTFTTAPVASESSVGPSQLPDGRVWEMVSPPYKNNADIFRGYAWASASGDAVAFKSQGSFAGEPTSRAGLVSDYIARRGESSWATSAITPGNGNFTLFAGQYGFTEDLNTGFLVQNVKPGDTGLDPEYPSEQTPGLGGYLNWYLRDNLTGKYRLVSPVLPGNNVGAIFRGGSADYSHLALGSERHLTSDAPCSESISAESADGGNPPCAYEYDEGALRLASVLPGEVPSYGEADGISKDGSNYYFTTGEHLYDRADGSSTTQIDVSERTSPAIVPTGSVTYLQTDARSEDKVLFTTSKDLVDADENSSEDLYLYDGSKPAGSRLTLISKGDVSGAPTESPAMLLASENLDRVYFTTNNQLLSGGKATPGRHIYLWEENGGQGSLREVVTASSEDLLKPASNANNLPVSVSVSPSGQYLLFISKAQLTSYDNAGTDQAYRYDAVDGGLVCVSCRPDGTPGATAATLEDYGEGNPSEHHLRNVDDNGNVIFQSVEPLALRDSNGQRDVYEYEDGTPRLISSGVGGSESWFIDASVSGNDIFFATRDRLVGWDTDNNYDVYDARVDGGLPEAPPPIVGCDGDACQPPPNPPNDPTPASTTFHGAGNVRPKPVTHKKRHKAKHKKKKHHKVSSKHRNARTTRKHG